MRTIKIFNSESNNTREISSSAEVWSDLQEDLRNSGIDVANKKVVVRETKNSLEADDAKLPAGPFTLFLFPMKVKSGEGRTEDEVKEIKENVIDEIETFYEEITNIIDEKTKELEVKIEAKFQKFNETINELAEEARKLAPKINS